MNGVYIPGENCYRETIQILPNDIDRVTRNFVN
jgi:hypothetical protein